MAVDSAAHIASLNAALPTGSDQLAEADNNFRHIKTVLVTDFPNIAGPVTATHTELNTVTSRSLRAGDAYTGTHNFTGATSVTVPTAVTGSQPTTLAQVQAMTISATAPTWAVTSTAVSKTLVPFEFCRVTASGQTMTFPASTNYGVDRIGIELASGVTCTLDPNGQNIKGSAGTMTCSKPGLTLVFTLIDSTVGWVLGA